MLMLLEPSVVTMRVSLSSVPVGVPGPGRKLTTIEQVPSGWTTTTASPTPRQVPTAVKSGEFAVLTPVKPRGPRPVFVMVIVGACPRPPMGVEPGTVAVGAAGEGVPGAAVRGPAKATWGLLVI